MLFFRSSNASELGNEPRLHFHGVLWDVSCSYNAIREAVKDLGFVWISAITDKLPFGML